METQTNSNNFQALVDRYLAAWNETDAERRRKLIASTYTETARYLDPMMAGENQAGIDAMIEAAQGQFAGLRFRQTGTADGHHDRVRFSWELVPAQAQGPAVVAGTDFGLLAPDGRLQTVTGFIDLMPAAQS